MQYKKGTPLGDTVTCRDIYGDQITLPLEKMIFRNSVYGLILNEGKLLVVRTHSTGLFAFPGGGIEMGEPIVDALHREIWEETGILVEMEELATLTEDFFYYNPGDEATTPCCSFTGADRSPLTWSLIQMSMMMNPKHRAGCRSATLWLRTFKSSAVPSFSLFRRL